MTVCVDVYMCVLLCKRATMYASYSPTHLIECYFNDLSTLGVCRGQGCSPKNEVKDARRSTVYETSIETVVTGRA